MDRERTNSGRGSTGRSAACAEALDDLEKRFVQPRALKALDDLEKRFVQPPALNAIEDLEKRMAQPPALKAFDNWTKRMAQPPALKAIDDLERRMSSAPALKAFDNWTKRMHASPVLEALGDLRTRLEPIARQLQVGGREAFLKSYETWERFLDEHWAEFRTDNPDHPPPILFLVASLPMALGEPLYDAVSLQKDDSALLVVLEDVVVDEAFVGAVQKAVQDSPLAPIPKRHLSTALGWVADGNFIDAYPPFYNGLESALRQSARDRGVLDDRGRLARSGRRVDKIDDVLADLLIDDPRFRRFLTAWIFGERGNPFRHGDVDDPDECRRQSLRLAVAVVAWLEMFGGWSESGFERRLELLAEARVLQGSAEG